MRYLKTYKIFESVDIINTLNDICLELNDDGFSYGDKPVMVRDSDGQGDKYSVITMTKKGGFYFNDIKDIIYRIKDILGDKITSFNYKKTQDPSYTKGDINKLKDESMENIKMNGLFIIFKK